MNIKETFENYIERETGTDPVAAVIWLHGLGADGHDFDPIVPQLALPADLPVRFIFPHAPVRPITINGGMEMRGWYDIKSLTFEERADRAGLDESAGIVDTLIQQQIERGISSDKIILAGFSQGCAVSLYVGLRYPQKLAGIVALSGYLPFADELEQTRSRQNADTPIFMAHGNQDPVIPVALAESSFSVLKALNQPVSWQVYNMPHSVNAEEIADISTFLQSLLR